MQKRIIYTDECSKISGTIQNKLSQMGIEFSHFSCPDACLQSIRERACHLLISTDKISDSDGIDLLIKAKRVSPSLPVVLLVNSGDIKTAVRAMKAGATDCLERPIKTETFFAVIESALSESAQQIQPTNIALSKIEEKVINMILKGKTNIEIAQCLKRSQRTIEVHRSHIMQKFGVNNLADLIKKSVLTGLLTL